MRAKTIHRDQAESIAWGGLRRYLFEDFAVGCLVRKDNIPQNQHKNARKQAQQIAACLRQAEEYFRAADNVSITTKPLLLYYGCTALATAQVLWRGTGGASLDKMRADYGEHGLERVISTSKRFSTPELIAELGANIVRRSGRASGLFGLWRQHSQNDPGVGRYKTQYADGANSSGVRVFLAGVTDLPDDHKGWNLLQLLKSIVSLRHSMEGIGIASDLVRLTISSKTQVVGASRPNKTTMSIIVHPGNAALIDEFKSGILLRGHMCAFTEVHEFVSGFQLDMLDLYGDGFDAIFPDGRSETETLHFAKPRQHYLNEFGTFFVSLYILGMMCRYYPDVWTANVQSHSLLVYIAEELCALARSELPLLTLSVLDECAYCFTA